MKNKKIRKHQGIIQTGGNKGRLKKGYRYSGKRLKSGLPQIIKAKKTKGGKILGHGGYGCVIDPVIKCQRNIDNFFNKNDLTSKDKVSKVFYKNDRFALYDDKRIAQTLFKIDPNNEHFIYGIAQCEINKHDIISDKIKNDLNECKTKDTPQRSTKYNDNWYIQHIMKRGMTDLYTFQKKYLHYDRDRDSLAKIVIKILLKTLKSVDLLASKTTPSLYNLDLKSRNVLVAQSKGNQYETYMIDFGSEFMPKTRREFIYNIISVRGRQEYIWPPEINLLNKQHPDYQKANSKYITYFKKYFRHTELSVYLERVMIYLIGNMISREFITKLNGHYPKLTEYILRMKEYEPMKRPRIKDAIDSLEYISKSQDWHYDGNWFDVDESILYKYGLLKKVDDNKTINNFKVGEKVKGLHAGIWKIAEIIDINPENKDEKKIEKAPIQVKWKDDKYDWLTLQEVQPIKKSHDKKAFRLNPDAPPFIPKKT